MNTTDPGRPEYQRTLTPEEIYEPQRIQRYYLPTAVEGVDACVGYYGLHHSYFFIMKRTNVDHLVGTVDLYNGGCPLAVGDIYYSGGVLPEEEQPPQLDRPIPNFLDLLDLTWNEINWSGAPLKPLNKLKEAPLTDALEEIADRTGESTRLHEMEEFLIATYWDPAGPPEGHTTEGNDQTGW